MKKSVALISVLLLALFVFSSISYPAYAYTTGDTYPQKYKDKAVGDGYDDYLFAVRNCTSFVAWCLNDRNGISFTNWYGGVKWGDAKNWASAASGLGYTVNSTPAVGAVAYHNTNGKNHVAWVSAISGSNVTVEEYNWSGDGKFHTRTNDWSFWDGYIHLCDLEHPSAPIPTVSCSDEYHSVDISWAATNNTDFYSIRFYDAGGNRIYLRDDYLKTGFSALLPAGNYYAEICSVQRNVWVSESNRIPFTVKTASFTSTPASCGWRIADGKLFRLYSDAGTWLEDKAKAARMGGRLAVVNTQAKQNAIYEMVHAYDDWWVFLGAQGYSNYYWRWEDGSAFSSGYTNWPQGKPDNWEGLECVLMMYSSTGEWEDVPNNYSCGYVAEFEPVSLNLSFYETPWAYDAGSIREDLSVSVTFADGSTFNVDDFQFSYTETNDIASVTVTWGGLTAQGQVALGNTPPVITGYHTENADYYGYDVVCTATDDQRVSYFVFSTWHDPQSAEAAVLKKVTAEADGSARCHVDIADYEYAADVYYHTTIIAYDSSGNPSKECGLQIYIHQMDLYDQRVESLTMTLPAALTVIEDGAFRNVAAQYFVLSPNVVSIGSNVFPEEAIVYLYGKGIKRIASDLFVGGRGYLVEMGSETRSLVELFDGTEVYYVLRNSVVPNLWSEWSLWSTDPVESNDHTQVEVKTQYRSASISYETRYTNWSAWSAWSMTEETITDANLKEGQTRLVYPYYCFVCPTCGWHSPYWGTGKCVNGHNISSSDFDINVYNITTPKSGCTKYDSNKYLCVYNGQNWYYWDDGSDPANQTIKTQYSYRTRTRYQEAVTGAWSDWDDTPVAASNNTAVETRTVYRFRTKN